MTELSLCKEGAAGDNAFPPVRRSMTLGESNRLQTEETERLIAHSRKVHGISNEVGRFTSSLRPSDQKVEAPSDKYFS